MNKFLFFFAILIPLLFVVARQTTSPCIIGMLIPRKHTNMLRVETRKTLKNFLKFTKRLLTDKMERYAEQSLPEFARITAIF